MSERTRGDLTFREGTPLLMEGVCCQLEGHLDVVDAVRERYGTLEALLSLSDWKRRMCERPGAIREVLGQESALEPVLATMREVRIRRARLETLVRKRIG